MGSLLDPSPFHSKKDGPPLLVQCDMRLTRHVSLFGLILDPILVREFRSSLRTSSYVRRPSVQEKSFVSETETVIVRTNALEVHGIISGKIEGRVKDFKRY